MSGSKVIQAVIENIDGKAYDTQELIGTNTCKIKLSTRNGDNLLVDVKITSVDIQPLTVRIEGVTTFEGKRANIVALIYQGEVSDSVGYAEITIYEKIARQGYTPS